MPQACLEKLLRLSPEEITPIAAADLCRKLGGLATFLLHPSILDKAGRCLPKVFREAEAMSYVAKLKGACWVVAVTHTGQEFLSFNDAIVLPVQWRNDWEKEDGQLPQGLKTLANEVRKQFASPQQTGRNWTLHPIQGLELARLPQKVLEGCYKSAWAPLAGGLLLAMRDGLPEPSVWATGAWNPCHGIESVEGVEKKLRVAARFGAKVFFLPDVNKNQVQKLAADHGIELDVFLSQTGPEGPRKTLQGFLDRFEHLADQSDSAEKRAESYLRIRDARQARQYYGSHILLELADKHRAGLASQLAASPCRTLVTVVSKSPELVYLAHAVLRPHTSLVLYDESDGDIRQVIPEVQEWLGRDTNCRAELLRFPYVENIAELTRTFQQLLREQFDAGDGKGMIIDVTPGKKAITLALIAAAPPDARFLYWHHTQKNGRSIPFKEQPEIFSLDMNGRL